MTRKDYVPIAAILRQAEHKPYPEQRAYITSALAQLFQNDNPNFSEEVFYEAAGFRLADED